MNHLDLFSGIGGFSLGIRQAGIEPSWIGYSEIDKYANNIFRRHFSEAEKLGGIESIQPRDLPRLDLVTFGFPCQDISIAGNRGGLESSRSGLFFEAMRIIRAKRPKYIIFENVKGLFSSNEGYDFIVCLQQIADSGYDGQWQLLNTRWFLPQNRERVYFVGHLRGECRPEVFPIGEVSQGDNEIEFQGQASNINGERREDFEGGWGCSLHPVEVRPVLSSHQKQNGRHIKGHNEDMFTLNTHNDCGIVEGTNIRRLTPTECERLQGFPDGWTKDQSDTQRYKQLGNAVSVPVVKEVIKKMSFLKKMTGYL